MPTHPTILFDFGGVLLEWQPLQVFRPHFDGDDQAIERFLADIDFYTWNLEQDRGRPFHEAVAVLSRQYPHYAHLIRLYDQDWEKSIAGAIQPNVAVLRRLKAAGYPLHGLSNFSTEKFALMQRRFDFFRLFETILLSAEVGLLKPDERIFRIMLQRIACQPEDCIYIDDSAANIQAARQLGMRTLHVTPGFDLAAALGGLGVII
jgi:2-haloacid dehalogenase